MAIGCSEPVAEIVSTSNASSYSFGSFTPGTSRILVVLAIVRGTTAAGSMTTVSGTSLTWTRKTSGTFNSGADSMYCYWARTPSSTAASVYAVDVTGDNGTGCIAYMFEFTGGDMTSSDPVKQAKTASGSSTNPTITLDAAMNTANGYCAAWMGALSSSNPANVSAPPSSWTEVGDNGFASPTSNGSGAYRAGGETGSTITFTANSTTWGLIAAEVKVVAQDLAPTVVGTTAGTVDPTMSPGAATLTPTISGTAAGTVDPTLTPGAVTITPDAASVTAEGVAPTISIAIPPQTLEPTVVGVSAGTVDPTLVAGAATLTPTVVGTTAGTVDPTLVAGAATLTPTVVGVASGTVDPTLTPGAATLAPDVAATASDGVAPMLTPGAVSVEPTTASVDSGTGTVGLSSLGSLELTPDTAGAAAGTVDPTLSPGAATLTPDVADGASGIVSPTLGAGAVSLAPDVAGADAGTVDPTLAPGAVALTPDVAEGASGTSWGAIYSGLALTPDPASASSGAVAPSLWAGVFRMDWALVDPPLTGIPHQTYLVPDGDGGQADFQVVGAADNWRAVRDGRDDTYCQSGLPGDRDIFTIEDLPAGVDTISVVTLKFRAQTTAFGISGTFRALLSVGGLEYRSDPISVDEQWRVYIVQAVPCPVLTGWDIATVNACTAGYEMESASPGGGIRFADMYMAVTYTETASAPPVGSHDLSVWRTASGENSATRTAVGDGLVTRTAEGSCEATRTASSTLDAARVAAATIGIEE